MFMERKCLRGPYNDISFFYVQPSEKLVAQLTLLQYRYRSDNKLKGLHYSSVLSSEKPKYKSNLQYPDNSNRKPKRQKILNNEVDHSRHL